MDDFIFLSPDCRNFLEKAGITTKEQLLDNFKNNAPGWLSEMDGMSPLVYAEIREWYGNFLNELKPCPFCGCQAVIVHDIYHKEDFVKCENCNATIGAYCGNGVRYSHGAISVKRLYPCAKQKERYDYAIWHIVKAWNRRA